MDNKNQHYVPQVYLRRFCRDDKMWVYDIKNDKYYNQPTKQIAKATHYYSFEKPEGGHDTMIENHFSKIEGLTNNVFSKIDNKDKLDSEDKSILSTYISFQFVRVPRFREMHQYVTEKNFKKETKLAFGNKKNARTSLLSIGQKEEEINDELIEQMIDFVNNEKYKINIDKNHTIGTMFELGNEFGEYLFSMDWNFHYLNKKSGLITSDNPLVIIPPLKKDAHPLLKKAGLLTPGALKLFPLGTSSCLVITDKGLKVQYLNITPKLIKYFNKKTALNATRYIFGRDKELLKRIVKDIYSKL